MNCSWARLPGNGSSLAAKKHIGAAPVGGSGALIYEAEDGRPYVVKLKGNNQSTRVLFNEYVCGRLGELIGVPFGEHMLVTVDTNLIPAGRALQAGTQFGTIYFPHAQTDQAQLRQARNWHTFPLVMVFDTLIALRDSRQFVVYPEDGMPTSPRDLGAICDQGHALTGNPVWTAPTLQNDNTCPIVDANLGLKQAFPAFESYEPYVDCVERLRREHFELVVGEAPLPEWGISEQEAAAVVDWFYRRKNMIRGAIEAHLR